MNNPKPSLWTAWISLINSLEQKALVRIRVPRLKRPPYVVFFCLFSKCVPKQVRDTMNKLISVNIGDSSTPALLHVKFDWRKRGGRNDDKADDTNITPIYNIDRIYIRV